MSTSVPPESSGPVLPTKQKSSKKGAWITGAVVAVAAIVAGAILLPPLFAGKNDQALTVVKLGTTDASQGQWPVLQKILKKEGIDLKIVGFDTYDTPNPALADGEIDINAFQHIDFLADHNNATGDKLAVVGPTLIVPLPIYSAKYTDVADIPQDASVAIPNDATNQARALKVLQSAGLITLNDDATPTPASILTKKVNVVAVDAAQTAPALNDAKIAAAVVNNTFATDAGILDKAIFSVDTSDKTSWPYINIIASRPGEENKEAYQKVWKAYHDASVTKIVVAESGNTAKIVEDSPAQVRDWLSQIEKLKAAAKN